MRKTVITLVAAGLLSAVGWSNDRAKAAETITGCLNKGNQPGEFILTEEKSGQRITVSGPIDLEKHAANHKVKVVGSREAVDGKPVFKATSLEHVADVCTPGN